MDIALHDVDLYDCRQPQHSKASPHQGSAAIVAAGRKSRWPSAVRLLERLSAAACSLDLPLWKDPKAFEWTKSTRKAFYGG